ncbi:MAG: hypothetical protein JXQ99_27955 [Hyphomicrobiaceae bacterium]
MANAPEAVDAAKKIDTAAAPEVSPSRLARKVQDRPTAYVCTFIFLTFMCIVGVWQGNRIFAPEMYHSSGPIAFAKAFDRGENFATFDLNINIREMRNEQISRFKKAPEVAVLGASHWQEAHVELLPKMDFYNAHVHRDYYEDMPAVVEMFVRHDKLPRKMIIAIRDRLFTPVADRTDFLWLPGIPYYQAMAKRLGIEPHAYWETAPVQRWREQMSVRMLYSNALRWYKAPVKPHATSKEFFETLDVLLPGGSIHWSGQHKRLFTAERSERLAKEFAAENFASPPKIDPKGVATLDRLLAYLKEKNVEVAFVHPPFNPIYYDRVKDGAYLTGLAKIEKITQDFAKKYGFKVFGSFDPAKVGCTSAMYIDAEHSNAECLGKVLNQYAALNDAGVAKQEPTSAKPSPTPPVTVSSDFERDLPVAAIGALASSSFTTSDALAVVSLDDVAPALAKRPPGEQRVAAASQTVVPLPVQRPSAMPPLPVRNPFLAATVNCFPHGPLGKHSGLLSPPRDRRVRHRQLTKIARRNVERPQ